MHAIVVLMLYVRACGGAGEGLTLAHVWAPKLLLPDSGLWTKQQRANAVVQVGLPAL